MQVGASVVYMVHGVGVCGITQDLVQNIHPVAVQKAGQTRQDVRQDWLGVHSK